MRDREEIADDSVWSDGTQHKRLILEVLLDIRELLQEPKIIFKQTVIVGSDDINNAFEQAMKEMKKGARQTDGKIV